jgi:hypothetical protein
MAPPRCPREETPLLALGALRNVAGRLAKIGEKQHGKTVIFSTIDEPTCSALEMTPCEDAKPSVSVFESGLHHQPTSAHRSFVAAGAACTTGAGNFGCTASSLNENQINAAVIEVVITAKTTRCVSRSLISRCTTLLSSAQQYGDAHLNPT